MNQSIGGLFKEFESPRLKKEEPSELDFIFHYFFTKGVDFNAFCQLPIPYILSVLRTESYLRELEEVERKKAERKKV